MPNPQLPERASLEYLKKLAKERLRELRRSDPKAKLAAAQLMVARDHGLASWRALKAEVERRPAGDQAAFFAACAEGDVEALRAMLAQDPGLVRASQADAPHGGWTGMHSAAQHGRLDAVRLLLEAGADPNAREAGDNTYPLHWAAAGRQVEIVRALLDAGGDVHGLGDVHELDAIGWATFFHEPGGAPGDKPEAAAYLVERGARHHIFSAMSIGGPALVRAVAEQNPKALERRMSRFEHGLTPLHFALEWHRHDLLRLLIELGAGLEEKDGNGHTVLEAAMQRGDGEGQAILLAAGARKPPMLPAARARSGLRKLAPSVSKLVPMIYVPDVAAALDWYVSIGFQEVARFGEAGTVNFGIVSFGKAEIMLNMHGRRGDHDASLWLTTDRVDEMYRLLRFRVEIIEPINDTFYHARQFGLRDLNGYVLYFIQQLEDQPRPRRRRSGAA